MDFEFSSKEELYKRCIPALDVKVGELKRVGYNHINREDIWNYLIQNVWINKRDLMLNDIVSDILHADNIKLDNFLKSKLEGNERT